MEKKTTKIAIIGAGISGLTAALALEKEGYSPIIYEKTDSVGGRVKTDMVDGYQLDHGFQVLLDAYPLARKYLDYSALELQKFLPGAQIFNQGKSSVLGDPLRSIQFLFPTLFSTIGSFSDKWNILRLNSTVKKKSLNEIFNEEETSTHTFLKSSGFSTEIIEQFFKPFFSGIFLEPNLETSSRMFQFVYKMFGTGYAVLPKAGIGAIPTQLFNKLEQTKITFNRSVESCSDNSIVFSDGHNVAPDYTIIATDASPLIPNLRNQQLNWQSSDTLYFTTKIRKIEDPLIGLISDKDALINNVFYHTSLVTSQRGTDELLSVTIVKEHNLTEYDLIQKVKDDLKTYCGITTERYLKHYPIKMALPKLNDLRYSLIPSETRLTERTFLAGDYLLNGSLNAAMLSGEMAALGVIDAIEKS
ncbi:FAD-dependent oxidoreductase [Maribacter sp. ACAM166]|uniref:FAD-dependent oxidoreductase n=1 Tax=Maribacter sp. ACAM166 TaxID=2508996 RepID=UPI0010FEF5F0|nr:FAD-dependent oxidoreductase [Maribacter sp. ACAM166]TLP79186.1 FAD-dependent oxidoreductase [Maribacter sp. ACAM166]